VLAQDKKVSRVPKAVKAPKTEKKRTKVEKKGPKLGGERFFSKRKATKKLAEAKWREGFKLLKQLIEKTRDDDPAKPELYYRLSEMHWERASITDMQAFDDEELCLQKAEQSGSESAAERCVRQRQATELSSQKYRDKAIQIYDHIVRKFPRYPRLDGVLFALAYNYQQKKETEKAKRIYMALIRKFNRSTHIPDTLLNIGEIYFEAGQVEQALKAYDRVIKKYKKSNVYGYALYKLAWCYVNKGQHKKALRQFIDVIKYSKKLKGRGRSGKNRLTLEREAKKDIVRTYVHIEEANPTRAIPLFKKHAPDDYLELSEKLADLYAITGQFRKSNKLYRELIRLQQKSYKIVGYQIQIFINMRSIGKKGVSVQEIKRLVTLWRKVKNAPDAESSRVEKDRKKIEELVRSQAVEHHILAKKSQRPEHYAIAYDLYREYVNTFKNDKNLYGMVFYFAELLYEIGKWEEAAKYYEKTLEIDPKGEFTEDAAHGTVLAYRKLLNVAKGREKKNGISSSGELESQSKGKEIPKPRPLTQQQERFIVACDLYSKYVKKSEYLVDIAYDGALQYYDANQFDKAIPRFKNIAENHKNHRLAVFSANLLLDTYNLMGDFTALNKQVDIFLGLYSQERDPEFRKLLEDLKKQSTFNECQGIEGKRKYLEAARCYYKYSKRFKGTDNVDKALYNAALNYEREKRIEESIQMRLKLVNDHQKSELRPKALYQIAGNLHALAIYSKASSAYEFFAGEFPKHKDARTALKNAAIFREGLGELDKAVNNYKAYLKIIGSDRVEVAKVFFSIGLIFEKQEKWKKVISHYKTFRRKFSKDSSINLTIESYTRTGNAYMKLKKTRSNEKKAQSAYKSAYKTSIDISEDKKKELNSAGLSAIAEARFNMAESIFREYKRTPLKGRSYRNLKRFIKEMTKKIAGKTKYVVKAQKIYTEVINFRSANWAIAALARIGEMYQQAAEDIYGYPPPTSFNEEQKEVFKAQMGDMAHAQERKAIDAYVRCLKTAQELRWVNKWSELAEQQLARLDPGNYRSNAEVRVRAQEFGADFITSDFISKLPEE